MEDTEIAERAFSQFKNGDPRLLYRFLYRDLLLFAASLLPGNLSLLAEDCVQDAIEKAYHQRNKFVSYDHLKAFLYRCIHNQAMSLQRSNSAAENYTTTIPDSDIYEEDLLVAYIESETLARLYRAIDVLPPEMRQILELSFEQGLKNKEIADMLGVAEITVKKRKARLIALLKKFYH